MDNDQNEQSSLLHEADEKVVYGRDLIHQLDAIANVDGVPKVQRKIKQEIAFLEKLKASGLIKKEQLSSSNLRHLGAVVSFALKPGVVSVCKSLQTHKGNKVSIDVIGENGRVWTKVIARNPKSLSALSDGNASYGSRSVLDQAQDYLECAAEHPHLYQTPHVVFEFVSGIEDSLACRLRECGVIVKGELLPSNVNEDSSDSDLSDFSEDDECSEMFQRVPTKDFISSISVSPKEQSEINTLNLDVTTMMAYVSNLTNGHQNFIYQQLLLSQQAIWEAKRPVKPVLDKLFNGKELVCCQAAWDDFSKIVDILGGPNEKLRTQELKKRLTVLPNDKEGPDEEKRAALKVKGRIRHRSKIVFNFGQRIRALTVSANEGFVRSAKQQGVTYAAVIHESRALTEQKERTAIVAILPTV